MKYSTGEGAATVHALRQRSLGNSSELRKKLPLVIVKSTDELSSFIDALVEILNDVRRLTIYGEYKPGNNIVTMQRSYRGPNRNRQVV